MFICSPVQNIRQRHIDASVFSFYLPVKNFKTKKASLRGIRSRYLYMGSAGSNFHFVTFNNIVERIIYLLVSHSILVFLPGGGFKPFPFHSSFLTEKVYPFHVPYIEKWYSFTYISRGLSQRRMVLQGY